MDPWASFANPRAYNAAAWVFSHSEALTWASLAIVVPDRTRMPEIEQLRRLQSRGVRMGTIAQAEQARHVDRVLLAYTPDAATLARAEALAEARVVVAIGDDPDQLRDWVNDHHPVHLGGASLLAASSAPLLGAGPVVAA